MKQTTIPGLPRTRTALKPRRTLAAVDYGLWMVVPELVVDRFGALVADVNGREYKVTFFPSHLAPSRSGFYPVRYLSGLLALAWYDRARACWIAGDSGEELSDRDFLYWAGLRDRVLGRQRRMLILNRPAP